MIRSFSHKGLRELFETGRSRRVNPDFRERILRLLDLLNSAVEPGDMNQPGLHFHALRGMAMRYSVRVSGNWRLTFGWKDFDATGVDLEDYH